MSSISWFWVITAIIFFSSVKKLRYSDRYIWSCSGRGATIYYTVYARHQSKTDYIRIIKSKCDSAPRSWAHINNTVALTILTFQHIQCLHLMYSEVAWVPVSLGTQVQPQITPNPDDLPDYLSVSYGYASMYGCLSF